MPADTHAWWLALRTVGAFNLAAWLATLLLLQRAGLLSRESLHRPQLWLCAGYVFGCAFRSAFPVYDVPRLAMVDSWLSSVVVGRSVATVAELCFAAQWWLLLRHASRRQGCGLGCTAAAALLPLIAVAEAFSWYSVLTTSNLGHVIEESLWALCAALVVVSLSAMWPRAERTQRVLIAAGVVAGTAYCAYMVAVDVPMYWARWLADEARGREYLSPAAGLADASLRWVVSHHWDDWKSEVLWMSLYFSIAVWLSIAMVHLRLAEPMPANRPAARPQSPAARLSKTSSAARTLNADADHRCL